MPSSPSTPSEIGTWARALQARLDQDETSAPMRYQTRNLVETGHVRVASYLSALLPRIPAGFQKDCLVLRLCTAVRDEPLQWPRPLLRIHGHRLEGRAPDMDPVEPPLWTLDLLPPKEPIPTGFWIDLVALTEDGGVLVDPETRLPPRVEVAARPTPLWEPSVRHQAFVETAAATAARLGWAPCLVGAPVPLATGVLRLPREDGLVAEVAQVVVQAKLGAPAHLPSRSLAEVLEEVPLELRQAIERVQAEPRGEDP